jgi:hypothetical protein
MEVVRMAAGGSRRVCDGGRPGPHRARRAARTRTAATRFDVWSPLVLDLVFVAAVVALFALVSAVAAGVEKL